MASFLITCFLGIVVVVTISKILTWRKAYATAKSTNFPVFLSPVHLTNIWWLMFYPLLIPFLNLLPSKWMNPWLPMAQLWNIWKFGYKPFQNASTDTFILSTPDGNLLWTCDPQVCHQLETQHPQSQVHIEMMKFYQVYGPNLGSVEGAEWKTHRSVINTGFTPSTNATVWKETTDQTRSLLECWSEQGGEIPTMKYWTSRLALHVISGVFFHKHMRWNEYNQNIEPPPPNHRMHYNQALFTVLARLGTLYVTPKALLSRLPMKKIREAHIAFTEWTKYMQELRAEILSGLENIITKKNKSILESIILAGTPGPTLIRNHPLPEETILGNIFFVLLAGHETVGNTLAFTLNILAIFPEYQRKIQEDLDRQGRERSGEEWSVEREYAIFQKGWIGAVIKEVLRLYCVVQFIPRIITSEINVVDSKGEIHIIPKDTLCLLDFSAAFRNPNTWSQSRISLERRAELHDSPAIDFNPSRWLHRDEDTKVESKEGSVPLLFPFGQGPHYCPGRLFAQVEMTAVLVGILADYSLELVVDEEVMKKYRGDEKGAWEEMRDRAVRLLGDGVEVNVTVQLLKELPIRLVKRSGDLGSR